MENPDKIVADSIKVKFEGKNLLKKIDFAAIADKLAVGTITEEDWKLMAELSLESDKGDGNAKEN